MTQYKFRMWDRVKPVKEKAFIIGEVVSQGYGQGNAWYRVSTDSGDVFNCREDEIELVERIPKNRVVGMLQEDVFEMDLLRWRTPDHHPEEGEGIVFLMKDRPHTDIMRGVFRNGEYRVWLTSAQDTENRDDKAALFPLYEEAILCWSGFETPVVPEREEKSEEDEAWADGCGQAFSPDAED